MQVPLFERGWCVFCGVECEQEDSWVCFECRVGRLTGGGWG